MLKLMEVYQQFGLAMRATLPELNNIALKHFRQPLRTEIHILLVQINKTKQNRTHQIEHVERKLKGNDLPLRHLGHIKDSNQQISKLSNQFQTQEKVPV